jgi:hypothetical protein
LKDRTSLIEAPRHSIATTRFLESEGINVEQLTRDLKSFKLKKNFNKKISTLLLINEKVQWFIKRTQWFNFIPVGRLYKQKRYGERKVSLWSN